MSAPPPGEPRARPAPWRAALGGLCLLALLAASARSLWAVRGFVIDDAFITLRYAEHLAQGFGPAWNPGERPRVEGYTNPSWMLALATLRAGGVAGPAALTLLGGLSLAALAAAALALGRQLGLGRFERAVAALSVVAHPLTAVHTLSGLETTLYAALILAVLGAALRCEVAASRGALLALGLVGALLGLTRPEGWAIAGAALLAVALPRREDTGDGSRGGGPAAAPTRRLLPLAVLAGALALATAARLAWHGDWVPNTFLVKQGRPGTLRADQAEDLRRFLIDSAPLALAALPAAAALGRAGARSAVATVAALTALTLYYLGADLTMNYAHRFFFPLLPVGTLLALAGLSRALGAGMPARLRERAAGRGGASARGGRTLLLTLACLGQLAWAERAGVGHRAFAWEYGRALDGTHAALGRLLRASVPAGTTLAAGDAGALPYFSGLPTLDYLGLNDRHLARHPAPWLPGGIDVDHVLAARPTLLVLVAAGPAGFPPPPPRGIRAVSHDLWAHPAARGYRELGRRPFGGRPDYTVVLLALRTWEPPAPLIEGLRAWSAE